MNIYGPWKWSDPLQHKLLERVDKIWAHLTDNNQCEVIALQEVWTKKVARKIRDLAIKKGYESIYHSFESKLSSGLMLLYKKKSLQLINSKQTTFNKNSPGFGGLIRELPFVAIKKGFTNTLLKFSSDKQLRIVNIHLQPLQEKENFIQEHATQLSQLLDLYTSLEKSVNRQPMIVLGDTNSPPGSLVDRFIKTFFKLQDSYLSVNGNYRPGSCTYCLFEDEALVLDYIYVSSATLSPFKSTISPLNDYTSSISDHLSLVSTLDFKTLFAGPSGQTQKINILIEMKKVLKKVKKDYKSELTKISNMIKTLSTEVR